jgi:hypothetical protein
MSEPAKPKAVNVHLIARDPEQPHRLYTLMDELIRQHHGHLTDAKIALAWRSGWKADADGVLRLGQCRKASDLDRELHGFDAVILLNEEALNAAAFGEVQTRALLDHELTHLEVTKDEAGETKFDEQGRVVYRIRKHDIEEFREIVARHGCWISGLEEFARAALEKRNADLFAAVDGGLRAAAHQERLADADLAFRAMKNLSDGLARAEAKRVEFAQRVAGTMAVADPTEEMGHDPTADVNEEGVEDTHREPVPPDGQDPDEITDEQIAELDGPTFDSLGISDADQRKLITQDLATFGEVRDFIVIREGKLAGTGISHEAIDKLFAAIKATQSAKGKTTAANRYSTDIDGEKKTRRRKSA